MPEMHCTSEAFKFCIGTQSASQTRYKKNKERIQETTGGKTNGYNFKEAARAEQIVWLIRLCVRNKGMEYVFRRSRSGNPRNQTGTLFAELSTIPGPWDHVYLGHYRCENRGIKSLIGSCFSAARCIIFICTRASARSLFCEPPLNTAKLRTETSRKWIIFFWYTQAENN